MPTVWTLMFKSLTPPDRGFDAAGVDEAYRNPAHRAFEFEIERNVIVGEIRHFLANGLLLLTVVPTTVGNIGAY